MNTLATRAVRVAVTGGVVTGVAVAGVAALLFSWNSPSLTRTVIAFLVGICVVCSLQLFVGNSGILSFGHVTFMAIGAYVTALVTISSGLKKQQVPDLPEFVGELELGLLPAVLLAGLVAALVAGVVGVVFVSMREDAMVMATLALLVVGYTVLLNWTEITRGSQGLFAVPQLVSPSAAIGSAVVFILVTRIYKSTRWGLRLRAAREDPVSAASAGINVARVRFGAWVLSAALTGMSGSLWSLTVIAFGPGQFFFAATFSFLSMLVVGGRESVAGAVTGVALVTVVTEVLSRIEAGVSVAGFDLPKVAGIVQLTVAMIIVLALVWRPQGILGRREVDEMIPWLARRAAPPGTNGDSMPQRAETDSTGEEPGIETGGGRRPEAVPALAAVGICKQFSGLRALTDVDISVHAGEILGLIGPNGSGKTTLLNVLSGITRPEGGIVTILGGGVTGLPPHRIARHGLARTFQNIRLFDNLTVRENVQASAPAAASDETIDDLLETMGLTRQADEYAATLPYGLQRRVEIARALVSRPRIMMLDEPAAGMNETESDALLIDIKRIRDESGCAVVVVDHDLDLITRLCDRIQVLDQGRTLAVGAPGEVARNPAVVAAYLGTSGGDCS